jgi:hypothetical protein
LRVGQKLLNLVADGVTNPIQLRQLTVELGPLTLSAVGAESHVSGADPL